MPERMYDVGIERMLLLFLGLMMLTTDMENEKDG